MTRGRGRTSTGKQTRATPRKDNYDQLARELFPEMNASLYNSSPSTYFRMRLASAALHLKPTADMLAARHEMQYGIVSANWKLPDDDRVRVEYVAIEVTVLFHHAAETLMRLLFAHTDTPNCPWLEVTRLTDFRKFKASVDKLRKTKRDSWDRKKLGVVLLGGVNPADAGLDITQEQWDEHIDASIIFLADLANRLLSDSNLYNTAKHGLSGIVDSSTKIMMEIGGEQHVLNDGPCIAYPRRSDDPDSTVGDQKWRMSVDAILIDSDMLMVELACKYIDSIFDVARRRYVGEAGAVWICNQNLVYSTILHGRVKAAQLISGYTFDLTTASTSASGERTLSGIHLQLDSQHIPDSVIERLDKFDEEVDIPTVVELPEQERYLRVPVGDGHLLPFSPPGSQSQLAN